MEHERRVGLLLSAACSEVLLRLLGLGIGLGLGLGPTPQRRPIATAKLALQVLAAMPTSLALTLTLTLALTPALALALSLTLALTVLALTLAWRGGVAGLPRRLPAGYRSGGVDAGVRMRASTCYSARGCRISSGLSLLSNVVSSCLD